MMHWKQCERMICTENLGHRNGAFFFGLKFIVINGFCVKFRTLASQARNCTLNTENAKFEPKTLYIVQVAKEAEQKHKDNGGDRRSDEYKKSASSNLNEPIPNKPEPIRTMQKAAKMVGV